MRRAILLALAVGTASVLGLGVHGWRTARPPAAVEDRAGVLGPFGAVAGRLATLTARDLGIDVRIVTLRDPTSPIAPLTERLFRELGVGDAAETGGVLVVLEAERALARIEVSYTLEGVFPDAFLARLARDQLAPYASNRASGMAVMDVVHFLRDRALDAVAAGELVLGEELLHAPALAQSLAGRSGGAGAQIAIRDVPEDLDPKRRIPEPARARYAPSHDLQESAAAYRRALADLAGDPTLELFTPASRVMRARAPVAAYEDLLRAHAIERSEPLVLRVQGDRGVLDSERPARGFLPILLVRIGGLWRVDLVETYKRFQFDASGRFHLMDVRSPYAALVDLSRAASHHDLAPRELSGGETLAAAIARLERSDSAGARFQLAELLFCNTWDPVRALPLYEEAARESPEDWRIVTTFADRAAYLGMPELAIPAVERLGRPALAKLGWLHEVAGQREAARARYEDAIAHGVSADFARRALERLRRGHGDA